MKIKMILAVLCALSVWQAKAQTYDTNNEVVQTIAGSGFSGYVDGVGQLTMFSDPNSIAADSHGNLFVWDSSNGRIRKIVTPIAIVTTFAGGGTNYSLPATGTNAFLWGIQSLTIDPSDNLWASGTQGDMAGLWKITTNAVVTFTLLNFSGGQLGVCADSVGNIYVSSTAENRIYRYGTNGVTSIFAGSGNRSYADGNGIFTAFNYPSALAADSADNIYVWDSGNHLIRKIDQNQNVTTIAGHYATPYATDADGTGLSAVFHSVSGMCFDDSGNLILACGNSIRKMDASSNVVTMAGSFTQTGYTNGAGNLARFNGADGVCISGDSVFVADSSNERIRKISYNPQPQIVTGANLGIGTFSGVTITGVVGRTYQIQSSPDMTAWTTRATILLTASPYLWIDQNPVAGNRFYRAILLP